MGVKTRCPNITIISAIPKTRKYPSQVGYKYCQMRRATGEKMPGPGKVKNIHYDQNLYKVVIEKFPCRIQELCAFLVEGCTEMPYI